MKIHRVIQLLMVCVVLLAGIALTLYYQLNQSRLLAENLKAEIMAELRVMVDGSAAGNVASDQQADNDGASDTGERQTMAQALVVANPPKASLSKIEYWISNDYSDDKQHGFAAWLELVEKGHVIIEHCFAPDYSHGPDQTIKCKTLADTRINTINESEIVLKNGKVVSIQLAGTIEAPTLSLTFAEQKIELLPGQKNTLAHGLSSLVSVKEALKASLTNIGN